MADIRIKDLTTTASSTASDDFIAVDGTTNGTRKLSAFSPSFGGNATVTGTLSSGGNLSVTGTSAQVILGQASSSQLTYLIRGAQAGGAIQIVQDALTVNRWLSLGRSDNSGVYVEAMRLNDAGVVSISATTASTTTSSGALVVSGGLGLAGNLNMGGSLSVAGGSGISLDTTGSASLRFNDGASTKWWIYKLSGDANLYYRDMVNSRMQMVMLPGADSQTATTALYSKFSVDATTASTTTSSGALVVGNGTSGGLGVGGSAFIGGAINMYGEDFNIHNVGYGSWTLRNTAGSAVFDIRNGAGSWLTFPGAASGTVEFKNLATTVKISATTASTATNIGALVVSGGVGVAGAIYAGGGISTKLSTNNSGSNLFAITRADGTTHLLTATDASDGLTLKFGYTGLGNSSNWVSASGTGAGTAITINNGVVASGGGVIYQVNGLSRWYLARDASTSESGSNVGSDFLITAYNDAGSSLGTALTIKRSDYAATFGGSIKTAAPSGGTAANWKLGTVATVSPTSPNRTIEVDIGGTIYYIHAKTTNN